MTQRSLLSQPLHLISLTATLALCDSKQLQPVRCFLAADAGGHCAQLLRILPVSLSTMCPHSIKPFSRTFLSTAHAFVAISVGSVASWNDYESLALANPYSSIFDVKTPLLSIWFRGIRFKKKSNAKQYSGKSDNVNCDLSVLQHMLGHT